MLEEHTGLVFAGTSISTGEDGAKQLTTSDGQVVPISQLFVSLDGRRIVDAFGNRLQVDGRLYDKTGNAIKSYAEKVHTDRKDFIATLDQDEQVRIRLEGQ